MEHKAATFKKWIMILLGSMGLGGTAFFLFLFLAYNATDPALGHWHGADRDNAEFASSAAQTQDETSIGTSATQQQRTHLIGSDENPCQERGTSIVAIGHLGRMVLCEGDQVLREYAVAMGSNGMGKEREGDQKTPLGTYSVKSPRDSIEGFYIFIEIGYPTPEQARSAPPGVNLGRDIGIHGPATSINWGGRRIPNPIPGYSPTWWNWTAGCIAVGTKSEIEEVADWVKQQLSMHKLQIHILE